MSLDINRPIILKMGSFNSEPTTSVKGGVWIVQLWAANDRKYTRAYNGVTGRVVHYVPGVHSEKPFLGYFTSFVSRNDTETQENTFVF